MYEEEEMADRRLGSLEKGRKKGVNQTAPAADATAPQISPIIHLFNQVFLDSFHGFLVLFIVFLGS